MSTEETESGSVGFNKRRAEGRDKNDRPKTLQLKARKLNPVNTICYVQILGTGMDTQDTSSSVLLFFDKQRFIFNAGEFLSRACNVSAQSIRLSCQRLITYFCLVSALKRLVDFQGFF